MTLLAPPETPRPVPSTRPGPRAFAALLWRRRAVLAFVMLLVGVTVGAGLFLAERQYTATARVAATPPSELSQSAASYTDLLGTVADVATSGPVLTQVAEETGAGPVTELRDRVEAGVVPGTVIVQVSVTDPDPEEAARIADAIAAALPDYDPSNGAFEFSVTEPAEPPTRFSSPNIAVTVLAGAALAVLVGVGAAVLADRITRTVGEAGELQAATDTAVLGVVPAPGDPDGVAAREIASPEFQSLRALRVALEFASSKSTTKLVVAAPAVGTDPWGGWLEVNLATTLAEVGHRVLLIDADRDARTRHPALSTDGPGFYDVLAGTAPLGDAVRRTDTGVDVLGLGSSEMAAPSLLELGFAPLLAATEEHYDVVLVHAGGVTLSEDPRIMAIHGAMLLTVPAGRVNPRHLQRAVDHLRMVQIRLLGSVLVGARGRR